MGVSTSAHAIRGLIIKIIISVQFNLLSKNQKVWSESDVVRVSSDSKGVWQETFKLWFPSLSQPCGLTELIITPKFILHSKHPSMFVQIFFKLTINKCYCVSAAEHFLYLHSFSEMKYKLQKNILKAFYYLALDNSFTFYFYLSQIADVKQDNKDL